MADKETDEIEKTPLIEPRGMQVVIEKLDTATKKNGIIYDTLDKKETYLILVRVVIVGDSDEVASIVEGSKMLCRPDDLQTFKYKGSEYYLVDGTYLMAYLND